MARKKPATFDWVRERDEQPPPDPRIPPWLLPPEEVEPSNRLDRREHRERMIVLRQLVIDVSQLPHATRRAIVLNERVAEELERLVALPPSPAHRRQLMRVKGLLQDEDVAAMEAAMRGDTPLATNDRTSQRWLDRLLSEGDPVLGELLDTYPLSEADHLLADRQQLRQLLRDARAEGDPGAKKARRRLLRLLRKLIGMDEGPATATQDRPEPGPEDPVEADPEA